MIVVNELFELVNNKSIMRSSEKHENPWEFVSRRELRGKVHVSSCNQCNETFGEEKSVKDHMNNNKRSSREFVWRREHQTKSQIGGQSNKRNKMAKQKNNTTGLGTKMAKLEKKLQYQNLNN